MDLGVFSMERVGVSKHHFSKVEGIGICIEYQYPYNLQIYDFHQQAHGELWGSPDAIHHLQHSESMNAHRMFTVPGPIKRSNLGGIQPDFMLRCGS